jgi:hypothetical protein
VLFLSFGGYLEGIPAVRNAVATLASQLRTAGRKLVAMVPASGLDLSQMAPSEDGTFSVFPLTVDPAVVYSSPDLPLALAEPRAVREERERQELRQLERDLAAVDSDDETLGLGFLNSSGDGESAVALLITGRARTRVPRITSRQPPRPRLFGQRASISRA